MTRKAQLLLLGIIALGSQVVAQTQVEKVDMAGPAVPGIYYNLPRTGYKVNITVVQKHWVPGRFAAYATALLGIKNAVNAQYDDFAITQVELLPYTEPDPAQAYKITPDLSRKSSGFQFAFDGNSALVEANNSFSAPFISVKSEFSSEVIPDRSTFDARDTRTDTLIRRIAADTGIVEQKLLRQSTTPKSEEQLAKEVADQILKMDAQIQNLLLGETEVAYDRGSLEYLIHQLSARKLELQELFSGSSNATTRTRTFYFAPESNRLELVLSNFDQAKGWVTNNSNGTELKIVVKPIISSTSPSTESGAEAGIRYRVPGLADVRLMLGSDILLESRQSVPQLGQVHCLPSGIQGDIALDPLTGNLRLVQKVNK